LSKERARRRAVREHEAALKAAARAAEAERRERKRSRQVAIAKVTGRLPGLSPTGKQTGVLARRRRIRTSLLVAFLLAVNVLVWVVRPDWAARLAVLIVSILAAPVLATLLFRRRG
jgi:Flp pilus assembly protein TadB